MKKLYSLFLIFLLPMALFSQTVFINEIHYDNSGTDTNEGIEVAGPAGTDLSGWKLLAYNGSGGTVYSTIPLSGTIPDQTEGYGTIWFAISGLQNGAPDGIALIDASSNAVQFLSYEGAFTALDGDASGVTSTDIGVMQNGSAADNLTLQLQGFGTIYTDFTWAANIDATRGGINTDQTFGIDTDPPAWSDGYPIITNILDTRGDLKVSLDEPGKVYYIVVAEGSNWPTPAQVKAAVDYDGFPVLNSGTVDVAEASTEYLEVIDGATPGQTYEIYAVAEDLMATPNIQANAYKFLVVMTGARSLAIVSPQTNDTYYVGANITFQWTSANITNIMIGGYDRAHSEYFLLSDDNGEPYIIDASLGTFDYTIPNSVSTDIVDIVMYDASDITFFSVVTLVNLVDEVLPSILVTYPEPGDPKVSSDAILLAYFDEEIYAGTGNVAIKNSDGTVFESFDITTATPDGAIEIDKNLLIIRPTSGFTQSKSYYVELDPGVVKDYTDNGFAGFIGPEDWYFSIPTPMFFDNFDDGDLTPWSVTSLSGPDKFWVAQDGSAYMSGFNTGLLEKDWLISPAITAAGYTDIFVNFQLKYKYGVDNADNYLKLYYSFDYDGNTANIESSTWTEIPFSSPIAEDIYSTAGLLSIPDVDQDVYFGFLYNYNSTFYRDWWVDNFLVAGTAPAGTDATLSDLRVNGETITGFNPANTSYTMVLPAGTSSAPEVTYSTSDGSATGEVIDATDLTGDAAARTTTVNVTAADGLTTKAYTIRFDPIIQVADLGELRAATDFDRLYKVAGEVVVTAVVSNNNQKWLQDNSAGIQVFDIDGIITTTYVLGDGITGITGTLEEYFGMLEFIPYEDPGATTSSNNTVDPQVLTVNEFKTNHEDYESELVSIEGVTFSAANGTATFVNGTNYAITVGSDATVLRTHFYNTTVTGSVIPATADVTGIAIWHFDEAKISPRFIEDIAIPVGSDDPLTDRIRIYPVPVSVELSLENIIGAISLDVIDITGSRVISRNIEGQSEYKLNVSELPRGIYFIRIRTTEEVITRKFIKE